MQLEFTVAGQTLKRTDTLQPVENSRGYLTAHFVLSSEFSDTVKARFKGLHNNKWVEEVMTVDKETGICSVPDDMIKTTFVCVTLSNTGTNVFITTNSVEVPIVKSGISTDALPLPDQTVNQYEEISAMYTETKKNSEKIDFTDQASGTEYKIVINNKQIYFEEV